MSIFSQIASIFIDDFWSSQKKYIQKSIFSVYKNQIDTIFFDDIFAIIEYNDIKKELEAYKFFSERHYSDMFTEMFSEFLHKNKIGNEYCIISVPMHWSRYFMRGFNHMKLIAKKLSRKTNIPFCDIVWVRFTRRQVWNSREFRLKNRNNKYFIKKWKMIPKNIIILDDVVTTGSTVNSLSKILKDHGAQKVIVLTLAINQ